MVSVEDNPPSLVVIVRRCLNTRFRPKRAKNAPCKKSNYVQHLLTGWVVLVKFGLSWFILRRGYYDTIEKTRYISLSEYFCICLCSNQKPDPPCSCVSPPPTHFPEFWLEKPMSASSAEAGLPKNAFSSLEHLWFKFCQNHSRNRCQISFMAPAVNPALFSRPNHLRWGQIGRQPPIKAFRLIWSWCGL